MKNLGNLDFLWKVNISDSNEAKYITIWHIEPILKPCNKVCAQFDTSSCLSDCDIKQVAIGVDVLQKESERQLGYTKHHHNDYTTTPQ